MLNAVMAMILALAALGLLLYLVGLLLRAARLPIDGFWHRWRFARCIVSSQRGDTLRKRGDSEGALRQYQTAFFLDPIRDSALAARTASHHVGLLSRLIAIADDLQGGAVLPLSIAKLDRLLSQRNELTRRCLVARQQVDWRRGSELRSQLRENRREVRAALQHLMVEILSSRRPERVH